MAALATAVVAVAALALLLLGDGGGYQVTARFLNAGQLVRGNQVQAGGSAVGSVTRIRLTDDGRADVTLEVDEQHAPFPVGTRAVVREHSLAGIADRFVEIEFPDHRRSRGQTIPDGGRIGGASTGTQVELDQLLNALDRPTRRALARTVEHAAKAVEGRGEQLGRGIEYLNPGLSSTRRLLDELSRERPVLERTLVDSSRLMDALAERRDGLVTLVDGLADSSAALASEKGALAESLERLPPFMRRANTTFVNLRTTLDELDPLVTAARPVTRNLGPLLPLARGFAADAEPALGDLRRALRRPGRGNDAIELVRALPRLARIAVERRRRSLAPGGHDVAVGETRGALAETVDALAGATPVIALARPYTIDFLGWFDDFSTTGGFYDALGATARSHLNFAENEHGGPPKRGQFRRCPGGGDIVMPDGSNVLSSEEQRRLDCTEAHRAIR